MNDWMKKVEAGGLKSLKPTVRLLGKENMGMGVGVKKTLGVKKTKMGKGNFSNVLG
jgi:hypothetical protein